MIRVLIADDEERWRRLLGDFLRNEGYQVDEAADGLEVVELARRYRFDLVLLDPPFHYDTLNEVLPALADKVAPGGVVLAESEREAALPERAGTLVLAKQYYYGKIMVSRYEKEEQA